MTVPAIRKTPAVPLLGRHARHSLVPARFGVTVACIVAAVAAAVPQSAGVAEAEPAVVSAQSASASIGDRFAADIAEASLRFGVPATWIRAIMRDESLGDARALSPKGAIGLMQIMPATYAELRTRYGLGADPYVPRDNILAGAAFIRELHDRYGAPGFLAAYSAGPSRYADHLATGRPLPAETRRYVALVAPMLDGAQVDGSIIVAVVHLAWNRSPLFIGRADDGPTDKESSADLHRDRRPSGRATVDISALAPQSDGLFVRRSAADRLQ